MAKQVQVFHYAGCSTCKKALTWLKAQGVAFDAVDLVETPPSAAQLAEIRDLAGVDARKLFNVTGLVYRGEGWAEKSATLSQESILAALSGNGRLIKRPLLIVRTAGGQATACIGFREDAWRTALEGK
jgi:arsenate reductase